MNTESVYQIDGLIVREYEKTNMFACQDCDCRFGVTYLVLEEPYTLLLGWLQVLLNLHIKQLSACSSYGLLFRDHKPPF